MARGRRLVWFTKHTVATLENTLVTMAMYHMHMAEHPAAAGGEAVAYRHRQTLVHLPVDSPGGLHSQRRPAAEAGRNGEIEHLVHLQGPIALLEPIASNARYSSYDNMREPEACRELGESLTTSGLISLIVDNPIAVSVGAA